MTHPSTDHFSPTGATAWMGHVALPGLLCAAGLDLGSRSASCNHACSEVVYGASMHLNNAKLTIDSLAVSFVVLALLANYSGFLFCRLFRATPGAVLFGDIGFKAAGSFGRNIVYATIYSLDATQCVILHLAATQSLRHIFPGEAMPSIWQAGAAVVVIACILVQVGSCSSDDYVFGPEIWLMQPGLPGDQKLDVILPGSVPSRTILAVRCRDIVSIRDVWNRHVRAY